MKILLQKLFKVIVPRSIKLIFINNKELIPKKLPFFLDSSLGIPYIVLWFNVCNKELLALRNNFRVTKKFLIAKFDCIQFQYLLLHIQIFLFFFQAMLCEVLGRLQDYLLSVQTKQNCQKQIFLFSFPPKNGQN